MNTPIQPAAPVNSVITIQPVTAAIANQGSGSPQNPLANLASGTTVEGFVVNRDAQNNPILRTAIGDLRVTSEVFLKTGSEVVFKVDTSQASLARILSVDGMSPQDYSAQNMRGMAQDTVSTTALQSPLGALAAQAGKPVTAGNLPSAPLLQAIILQGHPQAPSLLTAALNAAQSGPASVLAQLAQLRPGSPLRLMLLDLKLPPLAISVGQLAEPHALNPLLPQRPATPQAALQQQAPAINTPTINSPESASSALPNAPAASVMTPKTPLMQANEQPTIVASLPNETEALTQRVEQRQHVAVFTTQAQRTPESLLMQSELMANYGKAVTPKEVPHAPHQPSILAALPQTAKPEAAPNYANQVSASVIGHEADGANILHTPFATLKLYTPQPLPTGSTLLVQVMPETEAPVAPLPAAPVEESYLSVATRDLKSLDEAIRVLQQAQPDIARDALQRLPAPNHKLASTMLFFIAALKGGDVATLLGKPAIRELERLAPELLNRLRRDMSQMQSAFTDSPLQHWTSLILPMMVGGEMQQARLYISKDAPQGQPGEDAPAQGQRFVLEVGLSELGPMQFDGFVRNAAQTRKFDLMVRMDRPLSAEIRECIQAIFTTSLQISGMHGQVVFQQGQQHFIKPLADAAPAGGHDSANTILA